MTQNHRSRIRPGNLAMAIGVIVPIFFIDMWYMEWIDIFWSRSLMFVIKAVVLGAWYENTRERLIDYWIEEPLGTRTNKNYFTKVVGLDSLFSSTFNGSIYLGLVLLQHGIYPDKDPESSLKACAAVFFFSFFTGPVLGSLIDLFRRLWEDARKEGLKTTLLHCFDALLEAFRKR